MSDAMLLYAHLSDNELIDKIKHGNTRCFEVLVRRHSQSIYRVGRMFLFPHGDVEKLLLVAHSNSYQQLSGFDGRNPYRQWLIKLMLQECNNSERRLATNPEHAGSADMGQLEKRINILPADARYAFVLSEIEGLSNKDIISLLHMPEDLLRNHAEYAKTELLKDKKPLGFASDVYPFSKADCDALVNRLFHDIDHDIYQDSVRIYKNIKVSLPSSRSRPGSSGCSSFPLLPTRHLPNR
jgi:RNA polymerase sigma-70 factor, ECF subfamily